MSTMRTPPRTLLPALLVLAFVLSLMPAGASGGPDESIGVSGHWVIEVRDPDGALTARREFHNTLDSNNPISQILTSQRSPGTLEINLSCGATGCLPVCPNQPCKIVESRHPGAETPSLFKNLTAVNVPGGFQLRGFIVAGANTAVGLVNTVVTNCARTVAPSQCVPGVSVTLQNTLTTASISPGIPVVSGQQVLVTVSIGFAAGAPAPAATSPGAAPPR
jgi:hypothetical protein